MMQVAAERGPYLLFVLFIVVGVYMMLAHRNLLQSFLGLYFTQLGVIVFFISISVKLGGSIPITVDEGQVLMLHNPVPHALMVTAIVVSVATLGVATGILLRIQKQQGSLDDKPEALEEDDDPGAPS